MFQCTKLNKLMEHGNVFFTVTCFFPLIQYPMNLVKLVSLGEYLLNNDDQFYSNSDDVSTEYEAHLEQPHVVSGVQANGPPKHPPVEYSPIIREPVMEHSVHLPLQSDPVIAVHADAPRLKSSTRIWTATKWHKDCFLIISY